MKRLSKLSRAFALTAAGVVIATAGLSGAPSEGGSSGLLPPPAEGWRPGGPPPVFAFYNPGFQTPAVSGRWNLWRIMLTDEQITMVKNDPAKARQWENVLNNYNYRRAWGIFLPEEEDYTPLDAAGLPAIRAKDHPSIGPYDSSDPLLIRTHLKWAKEIGLTGLIVDWDGPETLSARVYELLDRAAVDMGSRIFLTIRYMSISDGRKETATADLLNFLDAFGTGLNTLRRGQAPVVFIGRRAMNQLNSTEWTEVIGRVTGRFPTLFFGDLDADGPFSDAFDGFYYGDPALNARDSSQVHALYMDLINRRARDHTLACLTVIPGHNDSAASTAPIVLPRKGDDFYKGLFEDAASQKPDCILVNSFNDWLTGTEIEPSVEYGRQFLDTTARLTRKILQKGPSE